jgi:hypothetical protein
MPRVFFSKGEVMHEHSPVMTTRSRSITLIGALCALPASMVFLGCSSRVDVAREQALGSQDGGSQSGAGGGTSQGSGGAGATGTGGNISGDTGGTAGATGTGGTAGGDTGGMAGGAGAGGDTGGMAGGAGVGGDTGGVAGGAGAGGTAGAAGAVGAGGDSGGTAGTAGTAGGAGAGGTAAVCDLSCVTLDLRAHPDASVFPVLPGVEATDCFGFHVPSSDYNRATAFAPIIGTPAVLHHMVLYKMSTPQVDGTSNACLSSHPDGTAVWSWAPGMGAASANVDLTPGDFMLEVHYLNAMDQPQTDSSGVRICACPQ